MEWKDRLAEIRNYRVIEYYLLVILEYYVKGALRPLRHDVHSVCCPIIAILVHHLINRLS